jgi:hypothetical protein
MRTWNCVHGYAALILAAALIMTACGDAESGPGGGGGGGGGDPPPPPSAVNFTIDRSEYVGVGGQDFVFHVTGLDVTPTHVKVNTNTVTSYAISGDEITLDIGEGLNAATLSDIEVKVGEETGTLKGMLTYADATKNENKYTDLLTAISKGAQALSTAGSPAYTTDIDNIRTDVNYVLYTVGISTITPDAGIATYFTSNNMTNHGGTWANGIDLAMTVILNNLTAITDLTLNGITFAAFKKYLIRIYMNKTLDTAADGLLKTILGTDVKTTDVTTLSLLPPKGRLGAPGAGLA